MAPFEKEQTETLEFEGTWDEIRSSLGQLADKRLHVTVRVEEDRVPALPGALDAALEEIWRTVPDAAWEQLPSDFGDNMDRYRPYHAAAYGQPLR